MEDKVLRAKIYCTYLRSVVNNRIYSGYVFIAHFPAQWAACSIAARVQIARVLLAVEAVLMDAPGFPRGIM